METNLKGGGRRRLRRGGEEHATVMTSYFDWVIESVVNEETGGENDCFAHVF